MNYKAVILAFSTLFLPIESKSDEKMSQTQSPQPSVVTESDGYRLSVSTPKETYMFGEAVMLKIQIENLSTGEVKFFHNSSPSDYEFDVVYSDARVVPLSAYGKLTFDPLRPIRNRSLSTLKPKGSLIYEFAINRIYDMTITGNYSISVSRKLPKIGKSKEITTVSSKPLLLLIQDIESGK